MIEVSEALNHVLTCAMDAGIEELPILDATGRILREDLCADTDFPPFDRVMMDGIAVMHTALLAGRKEFRICATQAAGDPPRVLANPEECVEIMTGAVNAEGANVVIPYEHILVENGLAKIVIDTVPVEQWKNIHRKGNDKKEGDILLSSGCKLEGPEIGVAAAIGKTSLKVSRLPRVAVISSGNELVEIDKKPLAHEIRRSNVYAIRSELMKQGIAPTLFHLPDEKSKIYQILENALREYDVLVLSGGVSMGKFDYIPDVLAELGVKKMFHRINQKPGKPFWFGVKENTYIFAFPGNPVSTFLCYHKYFMPWLRKSLRSEGQSPLRAVLTEDFHFPGKKTYFLQVFAEVDKNGRLVANIRKGGGSGDHANLNQCNGFLELTGQREYYKKGESFPLILYRNI